MISETTVVSKGFLLIILVSTLKLGHNPVLANIEL